MQTGLQEKGSLFSRGRGKMGTEPLKPQILSPSHALLLPQQDCHKLHQEKSPHPSGHSSHSPPLARWLASQLTLSEGRTNTCNCKPLFPSIPVSVAVRLSLASPTMLIMPTLARQLRRNPQLRTASDCCLCFAACGCVMFPGTYTRAHTHTHPRQDLIFLRPN